MFSTELAIVAVVAYLLGSIPTGFWIVRWARGIDLREKGSGNVGAMNSFEVTGRRRIGFAVALLDFGKGLAALAISRALLGESAVAGGTCACLVVLGHDFSPWIGFRGGRGLAPAAGALALLSPLFVAVWILVWIIFFYARRDIRTANFVALGALAVIALAAPASLGWPASGYTDWSASAARLYMSFMIGVIAFAHFRGPKRLSTPIAD